MFKASFRHLDSLLCSTCLISRSHWNLSKVNDDCLRLLKYNNYVVGNSATSSLCKFGLLGKEVLANWKFEASSFVKDCYNINQVHEIDNSFSRPCSINECENVVKQFFKAQHTNRKSQSLEPVTETLDNSSRVAFYLRDTDTKEENSLLVYGEIIKKNAAGREDRLDEENTTNMEWLRKFIRKTGKLKVGEEVIEAGNTIVYAHDHSDGSSVEPIVLQQLRLVSLTQGESVECKDKNDYLLILTTDLNNLAKASLIDAIHCVKILDERLWMMRLHRRLVPIKMAVVTEGDAEFRVKQLSKELCHTIRRMNISCLLFEQQQASEDFFREIDGKGIYTSAIVDKESFEHGFVKLRNRDDSIKSPIHISDVEEYLARLFC